MTVIKAVYSYLGLCAVGNAPQGQTQEIVLFNMVNCTK